MDKIILLSAELNCNTHQAFEMFTSNELLESWLVNVADTQAFVGGKYELFWEPSDRENNSTIGCKVTAIESDRFIAFEWKSPKQFKHFANNADPLTHVTAFFIPSQNGTYVYLLHSGWRSSDEWEKARQWQEQAWRIAFEELKKKVNG